MAANYVIVAYFCDPAGPFLKFQKNRHIAARKPRFRFGSSLKPAVFGFGSSDRRYDVCLPMEQERRALDGNNDVEPLQAADIRQDVCHACDSAEPPVCKNCETNWVKCDDCPRWYHLNKSSSLLALAMVVTSRIPQITHHSFFDSGPP